MRDDIHQAFQQVGCLRPAGPAIGVNRNGVGEHRADVAVDHRRPINPGQQGGVKVGWDTGREGGQVGAHVRQGRDPQPEEIALGVQRHLR